MNVLNLYAGIGGNRKLWRDCDVTAVELNPQIAAAYQDFFPKDRVIVGDAHQYLIDNFKKFDFIWSSPPCPTHSKIREMGVKIGRAIPKYPDMKLYEEIIFLKHIAAYFNVKFVVENVVPFYKPLIPAQQIGKNLFWSNFFIKFFTTCRKREIEFGTISVFEALSGFNLGKHTFTGVRKRTILKNCVDSELALHIFNAAKAESARLL